MKKHGFNFVELMLVMAVLGVIIGLTMPLLKNLKDDDDIYRAYMKKANQDITDMVSMAIIRNRMVGFTGFHKLGKIRLTGTNNYTADTAGLRHVFNTAVKGTECAGTACFCEKDCDDILDGFGNTPDDSSVKIFATGGKPATTDLGLKLPGKAVLLFKYSLNVPTNTEKRATFGYIYVDMNGIKGPNLLCQDRYTFILYKDSVAMLDCSQSIDVLKEYNKHMNK